jgi:hypothetical protein
MHGFAFALLAVVCASEPIELEKEVVEIQQRELHIPLLFDPEKGKGIERIGLFVSTDRGKTWKHYKDWRTDKDKLVYPAPADALYWFALQIVRKDGKKDPPNVKGLGPSLKVYVNSEKRPVKNPSKSYADLEREVEELRKTAEQLKQRIAELESGKKTK